MIIPPRERFILSNKVSEACGNLSRRIENPKDRLAFTLDCISEINTAVREVFKDGDK